MSDWLHLRAQQFGMDTFIHSTYNSEVFMLIVRSGNELC